MFHSDDEAVGCGGKGGIQSGVTRGKPQEIDINNPKQMRISAALTARGLDFAEMRHAQLMSAVLDFLYQFGFSNSEILIRHFGPLVKTILRRLVQQGLCTFVRATGESRSYVVIVMLTRFGYRLARAKAQYQFDASKVKQLPPIKFMQRVPFLLEHDLQVQRLVVAVLAELDYLGLAARVLSARCPPWPGLFTRPESCRSDALILIEGKGVLVVDEVPLPRLSRPGQSGGFVLALEVERTKKSAADIEKLRKKVKQLHALGVHTLIWNQLPPTPFEHLRRALTDSFEPFWIGEPPTLAVYCLQDWMALLNFQRWNEGD